MSPPAKLAIQPAILPTSKDVYELNNSTNNIISINIGDIIHNIIIIIFVYQGEFMTQAFAGQEEAEAVDS